MTVSYNSEVASSKGFSAFIRLLLRWKGSIYKLIWKDVIVFLILYFILNSAYRFTVHDDPFRWWFEKVVKYCSQYYTLIPLSFVLGFYVSIVMSRWWEQFLLIPAPDNMALLLSSSITNQEEIGRLTRRTIGRYFCLAFAITMSLRSPRVKKRFPTYDHFVEAGLLMKDEKQIFLDLEDEFPGYAKYWLPLAWAGNLVTRARKEGLINSDYLVRALLQEIGIFRGKCGTLLDYDWIGIPLVYTQVVTLAVYSYFLTTLLAQQFIDGTEDVYFPGLAILEFVFYMGWLKVAEAMINPFGEDDDDFEVNWLIDRHVMVTYMLVDKMHQEHPRLIKDQYWATIAPHNLPYTIATEQYMQEHAVSSTDGIRVNERGREILTESRRNTRENIDGRNNAGEYYVCFGNLYGCINVGTWIGRLLRSRNNGMKFEMRNHRPVHTNDEIIEVLDSNIFTPLHTDNDKETPPASDTIDFESLKAERLRATKRKLKNYMALLRRNENVDEDRLIDEIVDCNETPTLEK